MGSIFARDLPVSFDRTNHRNIPRLWLKHPAVLDWGSLIRLEWLLLSKAQNETSRFQKKGAENPGGRRQHGLARHSRQAASHVRLRSHLGIERRERIRCSAERIARSDYHRH